MVGVRERVPKRKTVVFLIVLEPSPEPVLSGCFRTALVFAVPEVDGEQGSFYLFPRFP
jgi:hypothetical protein